MLRTNKQTDKQKAPNALPRVGVGNYQLTDRHTHSTKN